MIHMKLKQLFIGVMSEVAVCVALLAVLFSVSVILK